MPRPGKRSRSLRRVFRKVASGTKLVYKKRKPSKSKCGVCGAPLHGVLRERPYKMRTSAKTKKRPSRPYGGNLCSKCMREKIREKIRNA